VISYSYYRLALFICQKKNEIYFIEQSPTASRAYGMADNAIAGLWQARQRTILFGPDNYPRFSGLGHNLADKFISLIIPGSLHARARDGAVGNLSEFSDKS